MIVIRPARPEDLDQLLQLASMTGFGLSTLPPDKEYLEKRLHEVNQSFAEFMREGKGQTFLFVMIEEEKVIGTCGIVTGAGGAMPFYAYRIDTMHVESTVLKICKAIRVLNLVDHYEKCCEIGSLFLRPDYAGKGSRGLGRLLSSSRFLFMAEHPDVFEPVVLAEMRGVVDEWGYSAFWESLGRHFFDVDFPKADYLSMQNKTFVSELMPCHPIYIPLLQEEAQRVIGHVHEKTVPALCLLQSEGFKPTAMVDIFEAGPIVRCTREEIFTVKESGRSIIAKVTLGEPANTRCLLSNTHREFRACLGLIEKAVDGEVRISHQVASALRVKKGDWIRHAPIPSSKRHEVHSSMAVK
tara:strand:+ start:1139 stop:2200 length:1062 start_codon:yes stop_codon:yes gene_type:complete